MNIKTMTTTTPHGSSARSINGSFKKLHAKLQNAKQPETFAERMKLLIEMYSVIRKILFAASKFGLIPPLWRDSLELFTDLFDVVAYELQQGTATGTSPDFRAGRDL